MHASSNHVLGGLLSSLSSSQVRCTQGTLHTLTHTYPHHTPVPQETRANESKAQKRNPHSMCHVQKRIRIERLKDIAQSGGLRSLGHAEVQAISADAARVQVVFA